MGNLNLFTPLRFVKGVGKKRAEILKREGIEFVKDLLYYFPFRYEDRRERVKSFEGLVAQKVFTTGKITSLHSFTTFRKRVNIIEALVDTGVTKFRAVWFNQPFLLPNLKKGKSYSFYGRIKLNQKGWVMENPEFRISDDSERTGIIPVYERIRSISPKIIRNLIEEIFKNNVEIKENLPYFLIKKHNLPERGKALYEIHFPPNDFNFSSPLSSPQFRRIIFEELFFMELGLAYYRKKFSNLRKPRRYSFDEEIERLWKELLPFELTSSQKKVLDEIKKDLLAEFPMRRLLQGEVGSGKTAVALLSSIIVLKNGYKVAIMAPTEILAEQHYLRTKYLFKKLPFPIFLLTGSTPKKEREKIINTLKEDQPLLIIGTHSLFQSEVDFSDLGYVIIDEQHRFGVSQRTSLYLKGNLTDLLVMSATPIPRSLSLTLYSDLDLSVIEESPRERKVRTILVRDRGTLYKEIEEKLRRGEQGYFIYPLIEESEKVDLKAVVSGFENLSKIFKDFNVRMLHGRLPSREKEKIMADFEEGKINILVSTPVVEVGIDVSNATFMVIENAERFGLAQLHQMRGRIGRGEKESICYLILGKNAGKEARERINILMKTNDGFIISQKDLEMRGPGNPVGKAQWGFMNFRLANPLRDVEILSLAREEAFNIINNPDDYPEISSYLRKLEERESQVSFS
jgi:ATP-dependent DNA helicase RecG